MEDLMVNGWGIYQSTGDWRFSADTVALADFCHVRRGEKILDLGMGDGALSFLLLAREPSSSALGVERRVEAVSRALKGIRHNGISERCGVIEGDIGNWRSLITPASFTLAVSNPPYPGPHQAGEKFTDCRVMPPENMAIWFQAAAWALKNRGRMCFVYPCSFLQEILCALRASGLFLKRFEIVITENGSKVFLAEAVKGARPGGTVVSIRDISRKGAGND